MPSPSSTPRRAMAATGSTPRTRMSSPASSPRQQKVTGSASHPILESAAANHPILQSCVSQPVQVVIAGAGPAGLLAAHILLNRGETYQVTLIERGGEMTPAKCKVDRAWTIGLAVQGLEAVKLVPGLYERLKVMGIRSKGAELHFGKSTVRPRVDPSMEGYFVDRNSICAEQMQHLLEAHGNSSRLRILYRTRLLGVDALARSAICKGDEDGTVKYLQYDLLLGCDGVRSVVRDAFLRTHDFEMSVQDNFARVKNLHVAAPDNLCNASFHLFLGCFGRTGFGGVGLPEPDEESRPTRINLVLGCFAHQLDALPKALRGKDASAVAEFFKTGGGVGPGFGHLHFDFEEMGRQFVAQDWWSHSCCRCSHYHMTQERILLMGDAAHATSPNLGQGMNTALADVRILSQLLDLHAENLDEALPAFSRLRVKEGRALTDLSGFMFSMDPAQQMRFIIGDAWRSITSTCIGLEGSSVEEVAMGAKCADVYNSLHSRMDAARSTNDGIMRNFFERRVGMLKVRPARGAPLCRICSFILIVFAVLHFSWRAALAAYLFRRLGQCLRVPPVLPVSAHDQAVQERGLKLPGIVKVLGKCPSCVLSSMLLKPPSENLPDERVVTGKSPHIFEEIVPRKVWRAHYSYQPEQQMGMRLVGQADRSLLDRADTAEERAVLQEDVARACKCAKMSRADVAKGGWLQEGLKMMAHMTVMQMSEGGLLLYSPVKVDEECRSWLDGMGRVEYIVSPSSSHTLFVKSAKLAYPDAKVVASAPAAKKLAKAGVVTNFVYTSRRGDEGIRRLQEALQADFDVIPIEADPVCELDLLHKASGTLCICDLLYTDSLEGLVGESDAKDPEKWMQRIYSKTSFHPGFAGGILPVYRYNFLDPASGFPHDSPLAKGAKQLVGAGIARLVKLEGVERVCSAHVKNLMDPSLARKLLVTAWSWACEEAISSNLV